MIYIIIAIMLPFLENLMWGLGLGSLLVAGALYLFSSNRLSNVSIGIVVVFSLFMDTALHIPLGTLLISIALGMLVFFLIGFVIPIKDSFAKFPVVLVVFLVVHLLVGLISRWQGFGSMGDVLYAVLGGSVRFAIFDLLIFFLLDTFVGRLGSTGKRISLK